MIFPCKINIFLDLKVMLYCIWKVRLRMSEYKAPKKGAVARLRELYKQKREQKRSPEVIEEIKEMFKRKEPKPAPKKIARDDRDLESP